LNWVIHRLIKNNTQNRDILESQNLENQKLESQKPNKKIINNAKYKMGDVANHNTSSDAWIVIDNNVYNITDWIPKHPGGEIILRGIGKEATELFIAFKHSEKARKILNEYFIGTLDT
jgi:cytochrome b involved in lipid metabolism